MSHTTRCPHLPAAIATVAALLSGMTTGCASLREPQRPIEQPGSPKALVFVASPEPPTSNYGEFTRGKTAVAGAAIGAAGGAVASLFAGPFAPIVLPILVAAGAASGAISGAVTGDSSGEVPASAKDVESAVASAASQLALADRLVQATAAETRRALPYRIDVLDPASPDRQRVLDTHRAEGYAGVIEVAVTRLGFVGAHGLGSGLAFFLTAEVRQHDAASGELAYRRGLLYQSELYDDEDWTRDGARLLQLEVEEALRALAQRIVESEFLGAMFTRPRPANAELLAPAVCGLVPLAPAPEWKQQRWPPLERHPALVKVESTTPRLAWQAFVDDAAGPQPGRVVYDLRIWRAEDPGPDTLVYERFGLAGAEHRVETPLASHATHHWSVRPRFERDGRPRALRWNSSYFPDYDPHSDTAEASYRSLLEDGQLRDIPCSDPRSGLTSEVPGLASDVAWTPCGCLDAIPKANRFGFITPD